MDIHLGAYWFADTTVDLPYLNFILTFYNLSQVLPKCSKVLAAYDIHLKNQLRGNKKVIHGIPNP
jgi:hypothetical protein